MCCIITHHNRWVAGVCGGLGEFFGISAFWFRLAFMFLLLPGGLPGLVSLHCPLDHYPERIAGGEDAARFSGPHLNELREKLGLSRDQAESGLYWSRSIR